MKTPPWKLVVPTVWFDLCKYKKSATDPTLYRLYYSQLLDLKKPDYTHILLMDLRMSKKQLWLLFVHHLQGKSSICTAELEAIVSALRDIRSTMKSNKFGIFSDTKFPLHALLS